MSAAAWVQEETHRAPDGFTAEVCSREGLSGDRVYGAFSQSGTPLFGGQLFSSTVAVRRAIDGPFSKQEDTHQ